MKLKLIVNGYESQDDYKLLRTTLSTVASLRKTAVLRFTSERLVIISTPRSSGSSNSTVLYGDTGQIWCTIPRDLFKLYTVTSARELNTITMEYNCDSLVTVFKRYDRAMSQGCSSDMTIKLQSMPEWNAGGGLASNSSSSRVNPVCALGITFEEILHAPACSGADYESGSMGDSAKVGYMSDKTVLHSFRIPVRLLFKAQDARIQEPMINYSNLMMCKLPPHSGEFGAGFSNFIKRVERYTSIRHIKLSGSRKEGGSTSQDPQLKIVVNQLDWHLELCWNGPLDAIVQQEIPNEVQETPQRVPDDDSMAVEDSEGNKTNDGVDVELVDVSAMVERAERESSLVNEVFMRCKDWKVCHKLYGAFEEVVLAISHDESCVLHCSLDRGSRGDDGTSGEPKERGQIIYYIARSKPL
ncbi:hypothetical protein HG536_0H03960 [Torulaspora globosa]|uniref:Checkpoint protein n=1 Tax=Torulaspora globosa TaxID=48254 RepID=A0A7G3ZND4_9SACH|nr:uncharacterized protein HG536_0H03960 [Torulaspora globosa]QLL35020.1 hypothetical protein HG536_0H03960 [Torulaspora globosa]